LRPEKHWIRRVEAAANASSPPILDLKAQRRPATDGGRASKPASDRAGVRFKSNLVAVATREVEIGAGSRQLAG
jgi:hypothetical protein